MKITHVISGLTKGGGEKVAVELANIAVEKGDEVTLVIGWPEDPNFLQNDIHPSIKIHFVSSTKKKAYPLMVLWVLKNKKWLVQQDILHCHLTFGTFFGTVVKFLIRSFGNKQPLIVETNHAVGMGIPNFDRWRNARLAAMRDGFVLMAKDPYWNKFIQQHTKLITAIIPNGIAPLQGERSVENRKTFFEKYNIPATVKYVVGTVGMLRADRSPTLYVPVFKEIYEKLGDQVHFVMAGAGPELEKIQTLLGEANLSAKVCFTGLINKPAEVILNLDIYVSVSVGETAGISMIEAALCQLPVVAIQLTPDYTMQAEDWVWSNNDPKMVGQKIVQLITDESHKKALSVKQFQFVSKNFTAEAMYNAYKTFYQKVIDSQS